MIKDFAKKLDQDALRVLGGWKKQALPNQSKPMKTVRDAVLTRSKHGNRDK